MKSYIPLLLISLMFYWAASNVQVEQTSKNISFNEMMKLVSADEVESLTFQGEGNIEGKFKHPQGKVVVFHTIGDISNPEIYKILIAHHVIPSYDYSSRERAGYLNLLFSLFPVLLMLGALFYISKMMMGGGPKGSSPLGGPGAFGKSNAQLVEFKGKVSFKDVAGNEDVKEDLAEIIEYIKSPSKFVKMGARIPKGLLMDGPPGTGKTLLAKAVAGEAGVPFFSTTGSAFVEMFVGVGASRVRDMFDQARKKAPCIIFIDEIDAIGKKRGAAFGNDERDQTLNQLLVEMDGFNTNTGVILIAATNRADVLDDALLRPGRFDRKVTLSNPDIKSREAILNVHSEGKPLDSTVDLSVVARGTPGFSGADLENLMNEAILRAVRKKAPTVLPEDFEHARDKIMMGAERRTLLMTDEEKRHTAFHEIGHALVGKLLPLLDPIHKVTIIPRGRALGLTQTLPTDDRVSMSKERLENTIAFLMGGRAAEELIFGHLSSGASNDIERATQLARKAVQEWGMSELGPLNFVASESQVISGTILDSIDAEVKKMVETNYSVARTILEKNKDLLSKLAEELILKETLTGEEITAIIG